MKNNFSILVNTTDSFEDCWYPFFKLFKKYYPNYNGKIYLNTESKDFSFEGLNIICIKNGLSKNTWSECLIYALRYIEDNYILYMQEDYFLNNFIKEDIVNDLFLLMQRNNYDCIHLHKASSSGPFEKTTYPFLLKFAKKAAYKISTQASLWNKKLLLKYLRKHENAWQFEVFGTKRAWRNDEEIYIYNFEFNDIDIIPYKPTGIVQGKWNLDVVAELFNTNKINIDFNLRGVYSAGLQTKRKITMGKIINRFKSYI